MKCDICKAKLFPKTKVFMNKEKTIIVCQVCYANHINNIKKIFNFK